MGINYNNRFMDISHFCLILAILVRLCAVSILLDSGFKQNDFTVREIVLFTLLECINYSYAFRFTVGFQKYWCDTR